MNRNQSVDTAEAACLDILKRIANEEYGEGTYELAEGIAQGNRNTFEQLETGMIDENLVKILFLMQVINDLVHQHFAWIKGPMTLVEEWTRSLRTTIVLTFHPTPNALYGCRELDLAVQLALLQDDWSYVPRAIREGLNNPLRNTKTPEESMLHRFIRTFGGNIVAAASQLREVINAHTWARTDCDGNPNVTSSSVLSALQGAFIPHHIRVNASEVREAFGACWWNHKPEDILSSLNSGACGPSWLRASEGRIPEIINGLTPEHKVALWVIADCEHVTDVLMLAAMLKSCGHNYRICPLLERFSRIHDWANGLMGELLAVPEYQTYLEEQGERRQQVFQVGPSDTGAHGGYWALLGIGHLIRQLSLEVAGAGFRPVIFVGAGRNPARGGGEDLGALAFVLPRLDDPKLLDIAEVMFTVQGGQAARVARSTSILKYQIQRLHGALGNKQPHEDAVSEALMKFAKRSTEEYELWSPQVRQLLRNCAWFDVLDAAKFSNRPLSRDESGAGLRAIALQQLLGLVGAEALILLGFGSAWSKTSEDERGLLMESNRFRNALRYAYEAVILTEETPIRLAATKAGLGGDWADSTLAEVEKLRGTLEEILGKEASELRTTAEEKKKSVRIRVWILEQGLEKISEAARVILLQWILYKLKRLG